MMVARMKLPRLADVRYRAVGLALGLAAACLPVHAASAADSVTLQLNWLPSGQKVAPYAGREAGLFEERDIDLEIVRGFGSSDTLTKVASGAADFGYVDLATLMTAGEDVIGEVEAIMSLYSKSPHAIITTTETGIESLGDLAGRTVATSPFSSSNLFLPTVLAQVGVAMDDVTIEEVEAAALTPLLIQGRVDAAVLWSPDVAFVAPLAQEAGTEAIVLPFTESGFNMYGLAVIAAASTIEENPDLVARFVEALHRSHAIARDDPAGAAEALVAAEPQLELSSMAEEARLTNALMFNEISERDGFGAFSTALFDETYEWLDKAGLVDQRRPMDDFIDASFVPGS